MQVQLPRHDRIMLSSQPCGRSEILIDDARLQFRGSHLYEDHTTEGLKSINAFYLISLIQRLLLFLSSGYCYVFEIFNFLSRSLYLNLENKAPKCQSIPRSAETI